jgi:hypothetical protein
MKTTIALLVVVLFVVHQVTAQADFVSVTDHGAVADSSTLNDNAFNAAISYARQNSTILSFLTARSLILKFFKFRSDLSNSHKIFSRNLSLN